MPRSRDTFTAKLMQLQTSYASRLVEQLRRIRTSWSSCTVADAPAESWQELSSQLHDVAGAAATFGYSSLSGTARSCELLVRRLQGLPQPPTEEQRSQVQLLIDSLSDDASSPDEGFLEVANAPRSLSVPTPGPQALQRVLVLTQHDELRRLEEPIGRVGYQVTAVCCFDELFDQIMPEHPAALVADIELMDDEAPTKLAQLASALGAPIPLILLSSSGDLEHRLHAVRLDAKALFVTPLQVSRLIEILDRLASVEYAAQYRILIIDDNRELSSFYATVLELAGMTARCVNDPMQAIEVVDELRPDVILLDLHMPHCSGMELAAVLRQLENSICVPIVFFSSESQLDTQLRALSLGGDDFLTKPIHPDHLVSAVSCRAARARQLNSLMLKDNLTGLLNHTFCRETFNIELARAQRRRAPLAVATMDLDDLKAVNAEHGARQGDMVLRNLARVLRQRLRRTDVIGRCGGDEFVAILLDASGDDAARVMTEICARFADVGDVVNDQLLRMTVSCGVASYPDFGDVTDLLNAAEKALAHAKSTGKGRAVLALNPDSPRSSGTPYVEVR